MRKTNERIVAFVAATAMMCSLLTGCGSKGNSGDGVVSTSNHEVTTTTPVTTTEATTTEATTEPTTTTEEPRTEEKKTTQTTEQTSTEATTKATEKKNSDTKNSTKTVQSSNSSSGNNNKQSTVASKVSAKANTTATTPTTTTVAETTSSTTEASTSTESTTTVDTTTESTSATTAEPTTTVESTSTETEPTTSTTTETEATTTTTEETTSTTTETETTTETTTTEPVTTNFDPRTYDWGDEKVSEFVSNNTNEENLTLSLSAILKSLDSTTFYKVNNESYTAYTVLDNCVVRSYYYNNDPSTKNETKIFYRYNISEESIMTDLGAINAEAAKTILRDAIANRKDTSSYGLRTECSFNICEDGNSICRNDSSISLIALDTILDNCKSDFLKTNAPELVKTDLKEIAWSNEEFYSYIARYANANGDIFATSFRELGITGASKLSDSCIRIGSSVSFGDGTVENDMIIIDNSYRGLIFLISTVDNSKDATATISVYPYTPTNYGVSIIDSMGKSILVDAAAIESLASIRFSLPYCFYTVPTSSVYDNSWNLFVESVKTPSNPVEDGNVNIDETTKDPVSEDEPKELEPVTTDDQSETTAEPEANNDSESDEEKEDVDKKVEENAELEEVIDNSTTTD